MQSIKKRLGTAAYFLPLAPVNKSFQPCQECLGSERTSQFCFSGVRGSHFLVRHGVRRDNGVVAVATTTFEVILHGMGRHGVAVVTPVGECHKPRVQKKTLLVLKGFNSSTRSASDALKVPAAGARYAHSVASSTVANAHTKVFGRILASLHRPVFGINQIKAASSNSQSDALLGVT